MLWNNVPVILRFGYWICSNIDLSKRNIDKIGSSTWRNILQRKISGSKNLVIHPDILHLRYNYVIIVYDILHFVTDHYFSKLFKFVHYLVLKIKVVVKLLWDECLKTREKLQKKTRYIFADFSERSSAECMWLCLWIFRQHSMNIF